MESTSASLLKRLRCPDDQQAWERFVELYTPLLHQWTLQIDCPEADRADLIQEVLLLLLRKLPDFDYQPEGSFRGWLRSVAHNCWRNVQRRRRLPLDNSSTLSNLADPRREEPFWEIDYRRHLARRALELMQGEFRPAAWRACWEMVVNGKPAAEVAQLLNMTTGNVYVSKSRVLARLRQELDGLLD